MTPHMRPQRTHDVQVPPRQDASLEIGFLRAAALLGNASPRGVQDRTGQNASKRSPGAKGRLQRLQPLDRLSRVPAVQSRARDRELLP
jgi:hypothetical protein